MTMETRSVNDGAGMLILLQVKERFASDLNRGVSFLSKDTVASMDRLIQLYNEGTVGEKSVSERGKERQKKRINMRTMLIGIKDKVTHSSIIPAIISFLFVIYKYK